MRIRKQVDELTVDDLTRFGVWEFALDEEGEEGQDEATVRPWDGEAALDPADGLFVVHATFTLADDTPHLGYVTPGFQGDTSIPTVQPVIVTNAGQVMFWYGGVAPTRESLEIQYRRLGRRARQVFPLRYASDVPLVSGPVSGSVSGFMHFRSFSDQEVVTVT